MCWEAPGDTIVKAGVHLADLHELNGKGEHKLRFLAVKGSWGLRPLLFLAVPLD